MKIPHDIIDKVKSLNIHDVIGSYINLKRSGANYTACCPFHDEKTPSFVVSTAKSIFKCYGCGIGGDVITFIQNIESLSFYEAIKVICEKENIPFNIQEDDIPNEQQLQIEREYLVLKYANRYFKSQFKGSEGYNYAQTRGYSDEIMNLFELSFAPQGLNNLIDNLKSNSVTLNEMESCALIKKHLDSDSYYDCFRNRLMFPIHDKFGKVIAFSGRALNNNQKPKYYNSAETSIFKKSQVLYGLHITKMFISKLDNCIITEGATDVISMFSKGIKNIVATLGTAFTPYHAKIIKSYTKNVTLIYDGDNAGLKAVFKGCQVLFKEGIFVKVCRLPDGQDPDSFSKSMSAEDLEKYIADNSKDFIPYRLSLLSESVADKVKVSKELVDMINDFPDSQAREIMKVEYMKILGMSAHVTYTQPIKKVISHNTNPEVNILRIALTVDSESVYDYFHNVPNLHDYFSNDGYKKLAEKVFYTRGYSSENALYDSDEDIMMSAREILNTETVYSEPEWDTDYHILKFDKHIMEVIEKQIFNDERTEPLEIQSIMLSKIKTEKNIIKNKLETLENIRRNIR